MKISFNGSGENSSEPGGRGKGPILNHHLEYIGVSLIEFWILQLVFPGTGEWSMAGPCDGQCPIPMYHRS